MKILIATHNPGKINEYKKCFAEVKLGAFEVLTLDDLGIKDKFEENEKTFKANAEAKAKFYFGLSQMPTMAEDGGFEIDYLNGEPGVRSRRWLGYEASDQELIDHLGKVIKGIPTDKRQAKYVAVSCLVKNENEIYFAENSIEGDLVDEFNENYEAGFPYRAFFVEKSTGKYLMDLGEVTYNKINHRKKNVMELVESLQG